MNLQLVLLAIFPSIILALIILFYDRYDKEPFGLLMKVFFFGMLATIPTIIAEVIGNMFNFFSGIIGIAVEAFIVVGLAEEFFKRRVVLKHAFNHSAFDEKLDGIVYCGFAAPWVCNAGEYPVCRVLLCGRRGHLADNGRCSVCRRMPCSV